jgi:hypothetical protein
VTEKSPLTLILSPRGEGGEPPLANSFMLSVSFVVKILTAVWRGYL